MKRSRPAYSEVRLYVDGIFALDVGHFLRTNGGSVYMVQSIRQSPSRRHRRYLRCLRWPVAEVPAEAKVWELTWYRRKRRHG
jgi:hypothetical protein